VVSNQVTATASHATYAQVGNLITVEELAADWWLSFTAVLSVEEAADKFVGLWWTDGNGHYYGLRVHWLTGTFEVEGGNDPTYEVIATPTAPTLTDPHEFAVQYHAASGEIEVFMDDVSLGSAVAVIPANLVSLVLEISLGAVANVPTISEVVAASGFYS